MLIYKRVMSLLVFVTLIISPTLEQRSLEAQSAGVADFDGSGVVDFVDFLLFAGAFGSAEAQFDLDGNGSVDFPDFLAFAQAFGVDNPPPPSSISVTTPANSRHTMRLVPAGDFLMGTDKRVEVPDLFAHDPTYVGTPLLGDVRKVSLDAYYIDQFEVTNDLFVTFLNAIGRNFDPEIDLGTPLVSLTASETEVQFTNRFEVTSPLANNLPVMLVSWYGADAY